jgi:hypothetical protein
MIPIGLCSGDHDSEPDNPPAVYRDGSIFHHCLCSLLQTGVGSWVGVVQLRIGEYRNDNRGNEELNRSVLIFDNLVDRWVPMVTGLGWRWAGGRAMGNWHIGSIG